MRFNNLARFQFIHGNAVKRVGALRRRDRDVARLEQGCRRGVAADCGDAEVIQSLRKMAIAEI